MTRKRQKVGSSLHNGITVARLCSMMSCTWFIKLYGAHCGEDPYNIIDVSCYTWCHVSETWRWWCHGLTLWPCICIYATIGMLVMYDCLFIILHFSATLGRYPFHTFSIFTSWQVESCTNHVYPAKSKILYRGFIFTAILSVSGCCMVYPRISWFIFIVNTRYMVLIHIFLCIKIESFWHNTPNNLHPLTLDIPKNTNTRHPLWATVSIITPWHCISLATIVRPNGMEMLKCILLFDFNHWCAQSWFKALHVYLFDPVASLLSYCALLLMLSN